MALLTTFLQLGLMVNPPKPGDISYDQFVRERYGCRGILCESILNFSVIYVTWRRNLYINSESRWQLLDSDCSKGILESLRKRAHIMTDGFNSCRNVVCNFTEGKPYHVLLLFWNSSCFTHTRNCFQVPCIPSHKYACPQELSRLQKVLERLLMFTTVSSSWKPLASPPSLAQGSVKRKGEFILFQFFKAIFLNFLPQ